MGKTQLGVEIQLQPAQQVFTGGKLAAHGRQPDVWQIGPAGRKGCWRSCSGGIRKFSRLLAQKAVAPDEAPGPTEHRRVGAMQGCREVTEIGAMQLVWRRSRAWRW